MATIASIDADATHSDLVGDSLSDAVEYFHEESLNNCAPGLDGADLKSDGDKAIRGESPGEGTNLFEFNCGSSSFQM